MFEKIVINFKEKSLKERFLLVIGLCFFLMYFVLGLILIFWKELPIAMEQKYRVVFGIVLIVYSFFRFIRFFNLSQEE
jgi:uncharacterized membrane protein (DUF485 family)